MEIVLQKAQSKGKINTTRLSPSTFRRSKSIACYCTSSRSMIGFFPKAYPDELLYSLCARYSDRVRYSRDGVVNLELFGSYFVWGNVGLPSRLNHLVSALPPKQPYSVEDFIYNNSLFPFYAPFYPAERINRLLKVIKGSAGAIKQSLAGTFNSSIRPPSHLRFCSACMREDAHNYGEPYWHRLHQTPGVEVCPDHLNFLESIDSHHYVQGSSHRYVSASHFLPSVMPKRTDASKCKNLILLRIAQDVQWLLTQRTLAVNAGSLHSCYMNILAERELTHRSGVNVRKLCEGLQAFYSSQLLCLWQCNLDRHKTSNWLSRFLPYLRRGLSPHPLRHLLFIQFLGYTAKSFFDRCKLKEPFKLSTLKPSFGDGPWYCLNPTCEYFRKKSIRDCVITYSHQRKSYYGTFRCACGFTYIHRLPFVSDEDQFRIGSIREYGPVWESALKEQWANPDFTLKDIALELGVYHKAVKYHALRLGLPFPRIGPGFPSTQLSPTHQKRIEKARSHTSDKLKTYRHKWLHNLKNNKGASRTALQRGLIHVHYWLSKHDYKWLQTHMPLPRWNNGTSCVPDWKYRDLQLAEEIRSTASQLMNAVGRPVRITKSVIFRDRKRYKWLLRAKTLAKLPLTMKALSEVVETRIQFSRRRILWAVSCFAREGVAPSFTGLAERAGVTNSVSLPEVNSALESAVLSLRGAGNTYPIKVA